MSTVAAVVIVTQFAEAAADRAGPMSPCDAEAKSRARNAHKSHEAKTASNSLTHLKRAQEQNINE